MKKLVQENRILNSIQKNLAIRGIDADLTHFINTPFGDGSTGTIDIADIITIDDRKVKVGDIVWDMSGVQAQITEIAVDEMATYVVIARLQAGIDGANGNLIYWAEIDIIEGNNDIEKDTIIFDGEREIVEGDFVMGRNFGFGKVIAIVGIIVTVLWLGSCKGSQGNDGVDGVNSIEYLTEITEMSNFATIPQGNYMFVVTINNNDGDIRYRFTFLYEMNDTTIHDHVLQCTYMNLPYGAIMSTYLTIKQGTAITYQTHLYDGRNADPEPFVESIKIYKVNL